MSTTDIQEKDITANGLDELAKVLNDLLAQKKDQYILFQLGASQALIKADLTNDAELWYISLRGLPAPPNVQKTISQFLQEKAGVGKENFHDFYDVMRHVKVQGTKDNLVLDYPSQDKEFKRHTLELAIKNNAWEKVAYAESKPSSSMHTFFASKKEEPLQREAEKEEIKSSRPGPSDT